ncbi:unnamed protein product [Blepharisma stoltei]|uniref:RanBP2-type domain-containing protein n=1 Tax=Blepharisma stoltei TaxID=1481888 RepID=A0AAU9JZN9_9CILI|nr:unnamed protein product [Blepharisma stoltei]
MSLSRTSMERLNSIFLFLVSSPISDNFISITENPRKNKFPLNIFVDQLNGYKNSGQYSVSTLYKALAKICKEKDIFYTLMNILHDHSAKPLEKSHENCFPCLSFKIKGSKIISCLCKEPVAEEFLENFGIKINILEVYQPIEEDLWYKRLIEIYIGQSSNLIKSLKQRCKGENCARKAIISYNFAENPNYLFFHLKWSHSPNISEIIKVLCSFSVNFDISLFTGSKDQNNYGLAGILLENSRISGCLVYNRTPNNWSLYMADFKKENISLFYAFQYIIHNILIPTSYCYYKEPNNSRFLSISAWLTFESKYILKENRLPDSSDLEKIADGAEEHDLEKQEESKSIILDNKIDEVNIGPMISQDHESFSNSEEEEEEEETEEIEETEEVEEIEEDKMEDKLQRQVKYTENQEYFAYNNEKPIGWACKSCFVYNYGQEKCLRCEWSMEVEGAGWLCRCGGENFDIACANCNEEIPKCSNCGICYSNFPVACPKCSKSMIIGRKCNCGFKYLSAACRLCLQCFNEVSWICRACEIRNPFCNTTCFRCLNPRI